MAVYEVGIGKTYSNLQDAITATAGTLAGGSTYEYACYGLFSTTAVIAGFNNFDVVIIRPADDQPRFDDDLSVESGAWVGMSGDTNAIEIGNAGADHTFTIQDIFFRTNDGQGSSSNVILFDILQNGQTITVKRCAMRWDLAGDIAAAGHATNAFLLSDSSVFGTREINLIATDNVARCHNADDVFVDYRFWNQTVEYPEANDIVNWRIINNTSVQTGVGTGTGCRFDDAPSSTVKELANNALYHNTADIVLEPGAALTLNANNATKDGSGQVTGLALSDFKGSGQPFYPATGGILFAAGDEAHRDAGDGDLDVYGNARVQNELDIGAAESALDLAGRARGNPQNRILIRPYRSRP